MTNAIRSLNSGLLVVVPSAAVYNQITKQMEDSDALQNYNFPDQDLLSDVFKDRWVVLPYVYNALKTIRKEAVHGPIWRDDRVKNVHYILAPKPWNTAPHETDEEPLKWWHEVNISRKQNEASNGLSDGF